jgi:ABC-type Fe3+ transport system permease subunit
MKGFEMSEPTETETPNPSVSSQVIAGAAGAAIIIVGLRTAVAIKRFRQRRNLAYSIMVGTYQD